MTYKNYQLCFLFSSSSGIFTVKIQFHSVFRQQNIEILIFIQTYLQVAYHLSFTPLQQKPNHEIDSARQAQYEDELEKRDAEISQLNETVDKLKVCALLTFTV